MNVVYRDTASVAGYSSQQKQSSMRHGKISGSGYSEGVASVPLDDAYLTRKKKKVGLFSRRRMSLAAGQEAARRTPPEMSRSEDNLHHSFPKRKSRRASMSVMSGPASSGNHPTPTSPKKSEYFEKPGHGFSFSSTKLGKMLRRSGFEVEHDFEVQRKSVNEHRQHPKNPRSPTRRSSCIASHSFGVGYSSPPSNLGIAVQEDLDSQKVDLRRTYSSEYPRPAPISPHMKIRKPLVRKENEVRKHITPHKGHSTEAWPLQNNQIRASLAQMESLLPPCLSGSDCSPSTCSESSMSLGELEHGEVAKGTDRSSLCITNPPLAPTHDALKVPTTEEQGPVDKKAVIDKIKEIDARLSCMLSACYETSRKLKMLNDDISISDNSDDLSDLSLVCERR